MGMADRGMADGAMGRRASALVPPLYINRKMFFHSFSASVRELLLNEERYELAVFGKISPIYPSVSLSGSILSIVCRFSQKL